MPKKKRVRIDKDVAADVLVAHDFVCCICETRGKSVQIHHIDEDPSNNDPANLSALCYDDHERTMLSGGFGRHLKAEAVTKYRDSWVERVRVQRAETDRAIVAARVAQLSAKANTYSDISDAADRSLWLWANGSEQRERLISIPQTYQDAVTILSDGYGGSTQEMMGSAYAEIDVLSEIWLSLFEHLPNIDLGGPTPAEHVRLFTQERFAWHHALAEPNGPGTGGSIVGPMAAGGVMGDLKSAIAETGAAIFFGEEWELADQWVKNWEDAKLWVPE